MSFDSAVRSLARQSGFECSDDATVWSELNSGAGMGCETCGPESWAEISIYVNNGKGDTWSKCYDSYTAPSDLWNDLEAAEEWQKSQV